MKPIFLLFLTIASGHSFAQTFDLTIDDNDIQLGKVKMFHSDLRTNILATLSDGVERPCTTALLDGAQTEDYNGTLATKSQNCRIVKHSDGKIYLGIEGYAQATVANYIGIAGDVKVYSDTINALGGIISQEHTFSMDATNNSQSTYLKYDFFVSWEDFVVLSKTNPTISIPTTIDYKVQFIATQTPPGP